MTRIMPTNKEILETYGPVKKVIHGVSIMMALTDSHGDRVVCAAPVTDDGIEEYDKMYDALYHILVTNCYRLEAGLCLSWSLYSVDQKV